VVILKPERLRRTRGNWQGLKPSKKKQDCVVVVVTVRQPNGRILERSVRQIALLEPHYYNTEKVDSESSFRNGHAGSLDQTQTDPPLGGLLGGIFQPPDRNRPCHKRLRDEDEMDPGNVTIVIAEPVSQYEGDNGMKRMLRSRPPET
jgi:hypothetical protein